MSQRTLPVTVAGLGLVAAALAGCGSSTSGSPQSAVRTASNAAPQPTSTGGDTGTTGGDTGSAATSEPATDAPSAPAAIAPSAAASVAPSGSKALPGVPAVANATDLAKEPMIAAGGGTPPAGLVTRDLVVGSGTPAVATDTVVVKYVGAVYPTGKVFDASWTDPDTAGLQPHESQFGLAMVVPGFAQGIVGMKPGGRREIVIPAALGYGPEGGNPQAGISATDTIVFVVDYDKLGVAS